MRRICLVTVVAGATMVSATGCTSAAPPAATPSATPRTSGASSGGANLGGGTGTTAPAASSPAAAPTQPAVPADFTVCILPVVTCSGEMRSEPAQVDVSADGSGFVAGLSWSGWGTATAQGTGTLNVNNCDPNCAQGTFTGYPATVMLTNLTPYGNGLQAYADMTVSSPTSAYGTRTYDNLLP